MINYWILGNNILGRTCFWRRPAVKLSIPLFLSPSHGIKMAWSCSLSVSQQNMFRAKMNKTMHIMHVSICYSGWMNNGKLTSWHPMSVTCDELMGILGDWLGDLGGKPWETWRWRLQVLGLSRSFPFPVGRPFGLVTWWPIEHQRVLNWGLGEICSQLGFVCHLVAEREGERESEPFCRCTSSMHWLALILFCICLNASCLSCKLQASPTMCLSLAFFFFAAFASKGRTANLSKTWGRCHHFQFLIPGAPWAKAARGD